MKKIILFVFAVIYFFSFNSFAQGTDCSTASPFCTASGAATFPAQTNTTTPIGPNYGCLGSQPNPAWFYLQIATSGPLNLTMSNSANLDIDFIVWGPFTSAAAGCASGLTGNNVACSYSANSTETGTIPGALVGEVYILLITNFSNQPTNISLAQTGGNGATNCAIVCSMTALTVVPGPCLSPSNKFNLSGTVTYAAPPSTGTLTISDSSSGISQIINAPFNPTSAGYTLTNLSADGAVHAVTAVFSSSNQCKFTERFTASPPCFVICPIIVDSSRTCAGVPAMLTAAGASRYLWSTGDTSAVITVGGFDSLYTVIGTTGTCRDTAKAKVTTFPPPAAIFSADTLKGCHRLFVNFSADTTGNSGASYSWDFGDGGNGSGIRPSHLFTNYGCQTIILNASYGPGCSTADTIPCMIKVFAPPAASFIVSPSEIDILAPTAYFINTSTNSTNWLWDFGDTTSSNIQAPEHIYKHIGTFPVTLFSYDVNGCIDSVTSKVLVNDVITMYIPNAFSPNKNDCNEIFSLYSFGISPDDFELLIFDRWGNQIFKTNDLNAGWNGALNNSGETLEIGTYVYHVNYKELTGKKHGLIGSISLIK